MGNKSSSELTLSFLLFAALCLESFVIESEVYLPAESMNWTEARLYCQRNHIDLVTEDTVDMVVLVEFLVNVVGQVWMGLLRNPENVSDWNWIDLKSGEGILGGDASQSSAWANGEPSGLCAVVGQDLKWHSVKCSNAYDFYCSEGNNIKYRSKDSDWYKASDSCKKDNSYLATITMSDTDEFQSAGWIGLYREAGETWTWIGDEQSDYRNWAQGEPLYADCGSFNPLTQTLQSKVCSEELHFVCYGDNLVLVKENKTWEDALSHCRSMQTPCEDNLPCVYQHDLLSLELLSYNYVRDRIDTATTDEVWTSLRFLGGKWWWSDGQQLEDQGMLPDCPSQWEHCGTLSKYDTDNWITRNCSGRRNFICYRYINESNSI